MSAASWNVITDVRQMFVFAFMVNAARAGTIVALLAAPVGWFMVLRRQAFAGHTLAVVGFPGAAGAALLGVSAHYGYFAFCLAAALLIGLTGRAGFGGEPAVVGTVQALALASGFLFVTLYRGNASAATTLLFGTFLGITSSQVATLLAFAAAALIALAVLSRPLLFSSVDETVAASRGVPVRALSVAFLVLLGLAAAEVSQITGSLLVFALLVLPAATARALTVRVGRSLALSVLIALAVVWSSLVVAYYSPYPIGFWITTIAFGAYVAARAAGAVRA